MNTKEEFEKWYLSRFEGDIFWSLKHDCYVPIKAHYMWIAWQEMIERKQKVIDAMVEKIYELALKLDIKDDAMRGYELVIEAYEKERLKYAKDSNR